jgi:hypothetical protein
MAQCVALADPVVAIVGTDYRVDSTTACDRSRTAFQQSLIRIIVAMYR